MGKLYAKKLDTDETPKEVTVDETIGDPAKVAPNEKKLKALEKARERRQQKKAEQEALKKQQEEQEALAKKQEEEKLAELQKKKEAAAEKRKQARLAKKAQQEPTPSVASTSDQVAEPVEPAQAPKKERKRKAVPEEVNPERGGTNENEVQPVKAKRAKVDANDPPKWFTTFLEGVKKEQLVQSGEKKSKADIKAEVQEHASKAWNDGYTRDRIQNENEKHLGRMYSMMFSGRKL